MPFGFDNLISSKMSAFSVGILDDVTLHMATGGTTFARYVALYNSATVYRLHTVRSECRPRLIKARLLKAFFLYHSILIFRRCKRYVEGCEHGTLI